MKRKFGEITRDGWTLRWPLDINAPLGWKWVNIKNNKKGEENEKRNLLRYLSEAKKILRKLLG
jgi:hypothetical protein